MKHFAVQHVRRLPAGWKVRTKRVGSHELRIGFPPGRRRRGAGKVIEVLHPKRENPRGCLTRSVRNPAELLIFGNPRESRFEKLEHEIARKGSAQDPAAVAATEGRKKYGAKRFQQMAAAGRRRAGHENPSLDEKYEEFHQMPATGVLEYDETQAMPKHSYVLGDLVAIGLDDRDEDGERLDPDALAMRWKQCEHISIGGDTKLSSGKDGQLYAVGGDQSLDRADLDSLDAERTSGGRYSLGPAFFIVYNARKADDGGDYDQYTHKFAEEGGRRPTLYYDPETKRLLLRGGSYTVEGRGIVN
jgi:hypothetical protein